VRSLLDVAQIGVPLFPISASKLRVTSSQGPTAFHQHLRSSLRGASRRISIASLYLGTGDKERGLLDDIRFAMEQSPDLQVRMILDFSRAQRKTSNGTSVTFISEMVRDYPQRFQLYLHRLPTLESKAWVPSPLDECLGVFHFKALVFDDTSIITGANLSDEYFHCREARFITVNDPTFAAQTHQTVSITCGHSMRVGVRDATPFLRDSEKPAGLVAEALNDHISDFELPSDGSDTTLVPLFQHPSADVQQERDLLVQLFRWRGGEVTIATPYPNFPETYVESLSARLSGEGTHKTMLICPSANSHGFTTGRGLKALVPGIYLRREEAFVEAVRVGDHNGSGVPALERRHYDRPGWVFHAKGAWFDSETETGTVIGSSSFGARSVSRDFDMSYLLVTRDAALRSQLKKEVEGVLRHAPDERPIRRPGSWLVPILAHLVKPYM
jgi:CDP-diacylglycerol--glycerol-3-phosphate 3-phosphatidyltransferase